MLVGRVMTALDMHGISISVMRLDDELLRWLDAPAQAPAWPREMLRPVESVARVPLSEVVVASLARDATRFAPGSTPPRSASARRVELVLAACARACIEAEGALTEYDKRVRRAPLAAGQQPDAGPSDMRFLVDALADSLDCLPIASTDGLVQLGRRHSERGGAHLSPLPQPSSKRAVVRAGG